MNRTIQQTSSTSGGGATPCGNRKPKVGIPEILRNALVSCHADGLVSADGLVTSDTVFRRFSADVFQHHRQDVRLREFQKVAERSKLVLEPAVQPERTELRIDMEQLQAEVERMSLNNSPGKGSISPAKNLNPFISGLHSCSLIRDDSQRDVTPVHAILRYVTTISRPVDPRFSMEMKSCVVCRLTFRSALELFQHSQTHGPALAIPASQTVQCVKSPLKVTLRFDQCQLMSKLDVTNRERPPLVIDCVYLYHVRLELLPLSIQPVTLEIGHGQSYMLHNSMLLKSCNQYSLLIVFHGPGEQRDYLEQHHLQVFETPSVGNRSFNRYHRNENRPIRLTNLEDYFPSRVLRNLVANNFELPSSGAEEEKLVYESIRNLCKADWKTRLNASNYCDMLELMTHVHDLNVECDLAKYKTDEVMITPTEHSRLYRIETAFFKELPTKLAEGDIIKITTDDPTRGRVEIQGALTQILYDHVIVEMEEKIAADCRYRVRLQASRVACRLELQALAIVRRDELAELFFPSEAPKKIPPPKETISWNNPCFVDNTEQQTAVRSIINRSSFPLPYILFGPPGTGKTTTIVEAIVQICLRRRTSHVLVTAQSNAACDEVASRLMKYLAPSQIFRFYARSAEKRMDELPDELKQCSNLAEGKHRLPTLTDIYKARVFICSLSMCGRLVQGRVRTNHFDYVFIDEGGSASEPATLAAIAGLVSSHNRINATVILAGDPYQLGPVIRSELAGKMGLGVSMLERLMNLPVYQKDPSTKQYNTQVLTKLVRNYRSHEALIKFSNDQFYDGELVCLATTEDVTLAENWRWLPNKSFPLILHTVFGNNKKELGSTSRVNYEEIEIVEFYLDFILKAGINGRRVAQDEIGIISPYQLQVQQLRKMCGGRGWSSVEIGSVEQYQGREKLVIILSTVRSHTPDVGFLNNIKRLNVAMTRAKALLVVIGNSYTLQQDPNWFEFIQYCTTNKAMVGGCFALKPAKVVTRSKRDELFDELFNILM